MEEMNRVWCLVLAKEKIAERFQKWCWNFDFPLVERKILHLVTFVRFGIILGAQQLKSVSSHLWDVILKLFDWLLITSRMFVGHIHQAGLHLVECTVKFQG